MAMASGREGEAPHINTNKSLQGYYTSLESRIGYHLVLGGTRHFGFYEKATSWPFPISRALRAMEDHLFNTLGLEKDSLILDAGCGVGHVAIHMAAKGLRVHGIDVVDHHIEKAKRNVKARGLDDVITVRKMDYHHLEFFQNDAFDGAYTMETFVHATDPEQALSEFFRVLKPGGRLALYEYDHDSSETAPEYLRSHLDQINKYAAMPSNALFEKGVLPRMLEDAGFENVVVEDLSVNITPMMRLFFVLGFVPYLFVRIFWMQRRFVNTVAGVEGYIGRKYWRYVAVSATKPLESKEVGDDGSARQRKT
ncbi:S-adenosyl-L-methionine-dependent methyltransferase [Leptodontidium sp. MPI-SDFR-AT-0119]|nr:S-adenosyl-L-methionine-dependent methyltransferase [Leptodontidium sp. MPI-SDFR-AT-0119]